jgi:hypothetical protein
MVHLILGINFGFWALNYYFYENNVMYYHLNNNNKFHVIYIERLMDIFIIDIGIIRSLFCFDYSNFKISLITKIINFNGIKNMAHLAMLVIFHVNMIIYHNFNLSHIHCIFVEKTHFLKYFFSN